MLASGRAIVATGEGNIFDDVPQDYEVSASDELAAHRANER
jgi:hypothetical protein